MCLQIASGGDAARYSLRYIFVDLVSFRSRTQRNHRALQTRHVLLGRNKDSCAIAVEDSTVSREHAALAFHEKGGLYLIDLRSTHGTKIKKKGPVVPNKPTALPNGACFQLGRHADIFRYVFWTLIMSFRRNLSSQTLPWHSCVLDAQLSHSLRSHPVHITRFSLPETLFVE